MQTISDIQFEEQPGLQGDIGLITLNRSAALNALNHDMFIALDEQLIDWEKKPSIKAVVIRAASGRAFCAGGDIRQAYERWQTNDKNLTNFFRDEYRLNRRLYHFSKPYVALLNGITMGGGAGISIHGSHRIGTEQLTFAMPETTIGFYPDVGGTYFLSRLPHKIGFYLGLTGARISYADCYAIGLIQEVVASDALPRIISTLSENIITNKQSVTTLLKPFAIPVPNSELLQHKKEIEICFAKNSVIEIIAALTHHDNPWCHQVADILNKKSPTSLVVTLKALQKAEKLTFDECMQMEYGITSHFVQGHDFFEGIRAAIIDKDQQPHWRPDKLTDINSKDIEQYFMPLTTELV